MSSVKAAEERYVKRRTAEPHSDQRKQDIRHLEKISSATRKSNDQVEAMMKSFHKSTMEHLQSVIQQSNGDKQRKCLV